MYSSTSGAMVRPNPKPNQACVLMHLGREGGLFGEGAVRGAAEMNLDDGTAIEGFDPVSYFDGVPRMGKRDRTTTHQGAVYRFFNNRNQMRFEKTPDRFIPAYGGFCAWGVLDDDDLESIQPGSWKIVDDRLLFFYKGYLGDGRRDWEEAAAREGGDLILMKQADVAWQKLATE